MRADRRSVSRTETQLYRAKQKRVVEQKYAQTEACVNAVLQKISKLLECPEFRRVAGESGIQSIPVLRDVAAEFLGGNEICPSRSEPLLHESLGFVIAWSFLFPLFSNSRIALQIDHCSPNLIGEIKDAFIMLVINGPFPEACCNRGFRNTFVHAGKRYAFHAECKDFLD